MLGDLTYLIVQLDFSPFVYFPLVILHHIVKVIELFCHILVVQWILWKLAWDLFWSRSLKANTSYTPHFPTAWYMSTTKRSSTSPPHPRPVAFPTLAETWCHQSIHGTTISYLNDGACTFTPPEPPIVMYPGPSAYPTKLPVTALYSPFLASDHPSPHPVLQGAPPLQPDAYSATTNNFVSIAPNLPYSSETHSIPPHVTTHINTNLVDVPIPPDHLSIFRASLIYRTPVFILTTTPTPP